MSHPKQPQRILTRLEYSEQAFELLRRFIPPAISAYQKVTWRDNDGAFHEDSVTIVAGALPGDPDKRAVIIALATYFRPGEIVPLKILGPLCDKDDAPNNGAFQRKLRELDADGWIVIHRGQGCQLLPGKRLPPGL